MAGRMMSGALAAALGGLALVSVSCEGGCHSMPGCDMSHSASAGQSTTTTAVINDHCPIMGSKIDPAKVPDSLVRTYKGQKIGFCCGGCPGRWDSMSDAKKDEFVARHAGK